MTQTTPANNFFKRRKACLALASFGAVLCTGCTWGDPTERYRREEIARMTPQEKIWLARFSDVRGYELCIDATHATDAVDIFNEAGKSVAGASVFSPRRNYRGSSGSKYGVPRFYRVVWREGEWQRNNEPRDMNKIAGTGRGEFEGGKVVGDHIVPVADRIPDELLAEMRKRKLGLCIKLRIHPEGVLLGWDLQGPPGTGPSWGNYTMAGGDFQEAEIYNGKALRMGWYIHPRTKERIETDF